MSITETIDRSARANDAARRERLASPDVIQKGRAVRHPSGGAKQYGKILRTLQRADPTAEPPLEAITLYKLKLLAEEEYDAWSAAHGLYEVGDRAKYESPSGVFLDYECILEHMAAAGKEPTEETWWKVYSSDAYILGYQYNDDLTQTCPWFQVDDVLEVVEREELWYLLATVNKVETVTGSVLATSIQWNQDSLRTMSVYK